MELGAELREVERLEGHGDRVWSLAWNPAPENCGRAPAMLASCSGDKTVRIWQPTSSGAWDCSVASSLPTPLLTPPLSLSPPLFIIICSIRFIT